MINAKEFARVFPNCSDPAGWVDTLNGNLALSGIISPQQIRLFLCQTAAETMGYYVFTENLDYSAAFLIRVFPKHFSSVIADSYARNPQKIANRVYANRNGNGSESSNDGWTYRGRGIIQLTGRSNYQQASKALNVPSLMSNPDQLASDKKISAAVAVWYWQSRGMMTMTTVEQTTRAINGGLNGLGDRQNWYDRLGNIFR